MPLTATERERLAYVSGATWILEDIQAAEKLEALDEDLCVGLEEAKAGYMDEDFLSDQLGDLRTLAKRMRAGDNRAALLDAIQSIEDAREEAFLSAEHGMECLQKTIDTLESLL